MMLSFLLAFAGCFHGEWGRAPNGEFWNGRALRYIQAPAFDFTAPGAAKYAVEVVDDLHRVTSFESAGPIVSLECCWTNLPVGYVTVSCRALDIAGRTAGEVRRRTFWKKAPFTGKYPPRKRSYAAARKKAYDYFLGLPQTAYLIDNGRPDPTYPLNGYPSKMLGAEIQAFIACAELFDKKGDGTVRSHYLQAARKAADYLIDGAVPAGAPLAHFPRTYASGGSEYGRFVGQQDVIMLIYPARVGTSFVKLSAATGERKYLEAAERIAATYLRLQGEDGTWWLRQNAVTGRETNPNRLLPIDVINFLETLHEASPHPEYRAAADRAFAYIEKGPLTDWNWEGQFEDTKPKPERWHNLSKHPACSTAMYILRRFPGDKTRLAEAEALVALAEDQFVEWEAPYGGDRYDGARSEDDGSWDFFCRPYSRWETPSALEQYDCYYPIDASNDKLILTYLALWRASGRRIHLDKARALGDTLTRVQSDDGFISTWLMKGADALRNDDRYHTWVNCLLASATALGELARAETEAQDP